MLKKQSCQAGGKEDGQWSLDAINKDMELVGVSKEDAEYSASWKQMICCADQSEEPKEEQKEVKLFKGLSYVEIFFFTELAIKLSGVQAAWQLNGQHVCLIPPMIGVLVPGSSPA